MSIVKESETETVVPPESRTEAISRCAPSVDTAVPDVKEIPSRLACVVRGATPPVDAMTGVTFREKSAPSAIVLPFSVTVTESAALSSTARETVAPPLTVTFPP